MKKVAYLVLMIIVILVGCTKAPSAVLDGLELYKDFLGSLKSQRSGLYYTVADIDGNSIEELIVLENTNLSVYSFDKQVDLVGDYDFFTGTVRLFRSDDNRYPGIFCFTVGGGANHCGYLTVVDGGLYFENLWEENYSLSSYDGVDGIKEFVSDTALIEKSRALVEKNVDMVLSRLE